MLVNLTLAGNSGMAISANVASIDHVIIEGVCAIGGDYSVESPGHTYSLSVTSFDDVSAQDLALGNLADNGGFTQTLMPQPTSVAIGIGGPGCEPVDQRNFVRTGPCDTGAVQANPDVIFRSSFD
jgi:hypothetical protein